MSQKDTQRKVEVRVRFVVDGSSKDASEQLSRDKFESSVKKDYESFASKKGKDKR